MRKPIPYAGKEPTRAKNKPPPLAVRDDRNLLEALIIDTLMDLNRELTRLKAEKAKLEEKLRLQRAKRTRKMASQSDKTIPNLENATPSFLLDEIARMRIEASRLKFLDGVYKQALEARVSPEELQGSKIIEGVNYFGSYSVMTQERIDTEAVKAYFADKPEELKKVMKLIQFTTLTTKAKVTSV